MKGDVGMSLHEKEGEQEDAYTETGSHPIPLHFREMIFPLVPLTFFFCGKAPIKMDSNHKGDAG